MALVLLGTALFLGQGFAQFRTVAHLAYILAPKDHILIRASQSDKLNGRIFQIQLNGFLNIPMVGRVRAAGLTVDALEKQIAARLRPDSSGQRVVLLSVMNCSPSRPNCLDSLTRK
jgi:protein involved in polysaccharide export with SLBB domain